MTLYVALQETQYISSLRMQIHQFNKLSSIRVLFLFRSYIPLIGSTFKHKKIILRNIKNGISMDFRESK